MKILIVEPGKHPRIAEIPHTLEAMQETVGGYIQAVYPWDDPVGLVCDEEGLIRKAEFNRLVSPELAIFGTFFLCGLDDDDFTDLPDELIPKYEQLFHDPQILMRTNSGNAVLHLLDFGELPEGKE